MSDPESEEQEPDEVQRRRLPATASKIDGDFFLFNLGTFLLYVLYGAK